MRIISKLILIIIILLIGFSVYSLLILPKMKVQGFGITYTKADYDAVIKKIGVEIKNAENVYAGSNSIKEGKLFVDNTFSEKEISALLGISNAQKGPARDIQVRFLGNNRAEGIGRVVFGKFNAVVYVKGSLNLTGPKSVETNLEALKINGIPIPLGLDIVKNGHKQLMDYINSRFASTEALNIQELSIEKGFAKFKGYIPLRFIGR